MRTLAAVAIVACSVTARPADAMVSLRRPKSHSPLYFGLFGSGLESYDFSRSGRSNVLGGGLLVMADLNLGGWPLPWSNGSQHLNWSVGARIRHLTSYDADHQRTSAPVDVLLRISKKNYPKHENYVDTSGWPTAVFEDNPLMPYVGIGATVDYALAGDGNSHVGVLAFAGVERWFAKHIGVYAELELRGLVHGGSVAQAGANAGVLLAF